jgi:hypothetical protein
MKRKPNTPSEQELGQVRGGTGRIDVCDLYDDIGASPSASPSAGFVVLDQTTLISG